MDEIAKYNVEIQDALTIAPRKVDDVQKYFSVYFCKDRGEKGFKTEEKENIVENVKKSPYTKGVGIVTSWCYPNYEEGVSKIFYLNPEMPFLANGP
ncbi:MAG: hypothetical protein GOV02_00160, partial [Candidatus Aenigmarchaeota archaeon]|nr:hypothetical protein [Candidatus Aenigmarchaeota archaeon]